MQELLRFAIETHRIVRIVELDADRAREELRRVGNLPQIAEAPHTVVTLALPRHMWCLNETPSDSRDVAGVGASPPNLPTSQPRRERDLLFEEPSAGRPVEIVGGWPPGSAVMHASLEAGRVLEMGSLLEAPRRGSRRACARSPAGAAR